MLRFVLLISFLPFLQFAGDTKDPAAGHSYHGDAFNQGPRQAARLMGGVGAINFDITTSSDKTKLFFLQGVGQLHGFWYFEAERSFRQAAITEKKCAMAYWGMAMANIINEERARALLAKAYDYSEGITEREQMYIDSYAVRIGLPKDAKERQKFLDDPKKFKPKSNEKGRREKYVKELEKIVLKFDDLEAKAFLVMNLWNNTYKGHKLNSHVAVNSLLSEIFAEQPMHPSHHYKIHLWDKKKPEEALESAAKGGPSAPSIAHMWHMPGHIYSRLHRFADAAWQQEASARTDHRHMMRDFVLPDQIHNFAHNNEWLTRTLINLGDVERAYSLARNMIELPRHPKYNTLKKGSANYGRQRIFQLLNTCELWETAIAIKETPYLESTDILKEQMKRLRLLGRAYYSLGEIAEGDDILVAAKKLQPEIIKEAEKEHEEKLKKEAEEAAKKKKKDSDKAEKKPKKEKVAEVDNKKDKQEKKKEKKRGKSKNEEVAEDTIKELILLKAIAENRLQKELKNYKDLSGLDKWFEAQVYLLSGKHEEALKITEKAYKDNKNKVVHMARHIEALYKSDKKEEAKKIFAELRKVSQYTDLTMRPVQRLSPIAKEFGYPIDWRLKMAVAKDLGQRPNIKSLGPFRWRPMKADGWQLKDATGKAIDFEKVNHGQPMIVIFYLGAECLHCVEQLNAFAPEKEKFEKAGIKLMAVSLENVEDLKKSVGKYSVNGKFPFPIVSDEKLEIFKKYKCFDDFENMALHGTFLIDSLGYIRWLDISYDPFTKTEFLLKESQRLLSQPQDIVYGTLAGIISSWFIAGISNTEHGMLNFEILRAGIKKI
ncbi:MAG: peroxiredoxin family protein [Lentisphaerales bacterium]|nr:peroxiredoxin family protein [Lentisphaerales bacterium]